MVKGKTQIPCGTVFSPSWCLLFQVFIVEVHGCSTWWSAHSHGFSVLVKAQGFSLALSASTVILSPCHFLCPTFRSSARDQSVLQSHFIRQGKSQGISIASMHPHDEGTSRYLNIKAILCLTTLYPQIHKIMLLFGSQIQSVRDLLFFLSHKCRAPNVIGDTFINPMQLNSTLQPKPGRGLFRQ